MLEQKRFKTFPKYLVVVLQRFVVDNWVPKKLEIYLKFDHSANHDFLRFAKPVETFGNPMPDPVE
jgi:ubiquitin carboxyl-terminal hydrolase 5/13